LTKIFGSPYNGTYFLAFTIFALGIFRDYIYHLGLKTQPSAASLSIPEIKYLGAALIGAGQILVITSIWALGLTGTPSQSVRLRVLRLSDFSTLFE
jgi:phosphatidylethanolamine N-methyltransferase